MKNFSKEQLAAIESVDGQILVVSCPGSGKTTVIIERLKRMVESGINPESMLNITFTKAAAEEMAARFKKQSNKTVFFSTIHSFCYQVLCKELGYTKDNIMKESDKWTFISGQLIHKVSPGEMEEMVKMMMSEISYVKNKELNPSIYRPLNCEQELFYDIYQKYDAYKNDMRKIDFDDMLIMLRDYFVDNPAVLKKYQQIYKYISVDEFQDVNSIQAEICYMLAGENGNLFVVGDDDQSIYKFRAADSSIMLGFPKQFPNGKVIYMGTNYRSGKGIVKIASNLIIHNRNRFDKIFKAFKAEDGKVMIAKFDNSNEQAKVIVDQIKKQCSNEGLKYEDVAILYRNNNLAIPFIAQLMKEEIPFYTSEVPKSHHDFIYEDIMAYYRIVKKNAKRGDFQRILNRPSRYLKAELFRHCDNIAQALDVCKLQQNSTSMTNHLNDMVYDLMLLNKCEKPIEFISYLSDTMNYADWLVQYAEFRGKMPEESLAILDTLKEEASQFDHMEDWILYVKHYELKLKELRKNKQKKGVCLSTYHSSKGLEWNTVYTVYVNEGITPFAKAETPEDLEEERRMFYVAITRAKENLTLSYIECNKMVHSPYFEEMGFLLQNIGIGTQGLKLDSKNGLGDSSP